ncbi:hypothetical protein FB451DRAFT_1360827 [Mycena latifolia]|nr:hypothetical protein FB451DRAFT_1360827 [Mycena latifolia]
MHPPPDKAPRSSRSWNPVLALLAVFAPDSAAPQPLAPQRLLVRDAAAPTTTRRHVPPRYSAGPDGIWRRIDSYTLVGSTICDTCSVTPTTSTAMSQDDFMATVPSGWVRDRVITSPGRTSLTVGLSLVLTCFIGITIVRCHFWRRNSRRKAAAALANDSDLGPDLEKRRAPKAEKGALPPSAAEGQVPVRKWMARATARWRDNARYIARQRRGRRRHQTQQSRRGSVESLVLAPDSPVLSSLSLSRTHSHADAHSLDLARSLSRGSTSTLELPPPQTPATPPPALTPPPLSLPFPEPPAYPARSTSAHGKAPMEADDDDVGEAHPPYTPRLYDPVLNSYFDAPPPPAASSGNPFAERAAHIATDDKALLARLAARASAPSPSHTLGAPASNETLRSRAPTAEEVVCGEDEVAGFESASPDGFGRRTGVEAFPAPPPPPPPREEESEKRALERAYAARASTSSSSSSAPVAYTPYWEQGAYPYEPSAPSCPSYPEVPEAGPSTPRRVSANASAPPLDDGAWFGYEEGEGGEGGASAPPFEEFEEMHAGEEIQQPQQQRQRRYGAEENENENEEEDGGKGEGERYQERHTGEGADGGADRHTGDGGGAGRHTGEGDRHAGDRSDGGGGGGGRAGPGAGEAHDTGWRPTRAVEGGQEGEGQ